MMALAMAAQHLQVIPWNPVVYINNLPGGWGLIEMEEERFNMGCPLVYPSGLSSSKTKKGGVRRDETRRERKKEKLCGCGLALVPNPVIRKSKLWNRNKAKALYTIPKVCH